MSKHELLKEIDYLTKLIESHESKNRRVKYESVSGCAGGASATKFRRNWTAAGQHRPTHLKHKPRAKNLVYKPNAMSSSAPLPEQGVSSVSRASHSCENTTPLFTAPPTSGVLKLTPRAHQLAAKKRQSSSISKKPCKKLKLPSGGQYVWLAKNIAHKYKLQPREHAHVKRTGSSQYKWKATISPQLGQAASSITNQRDSPLPGNGSVAASVNRTHNLLKTLDKPHSIRTPNRFQLKKRNRVWRANGENSTGAQRPTTGSETLSKRGNRVWVSNTLPRARGTNSGRSWKRRNQVWVPSSAPGSTTPSQMKTTDRQIGQKRQDFHLDKEGKRVTRLSSSFSAPPTTPLIKRALASRVVKKSLAHVWHARRLTHLNQTPSSSSSQQYCIFYNRFGKCTRGDHCPFIHDPERVAVCTKFLRGVCSKMDGTCPFYHKVTKEKMPVCSFFLRGVCARDECPYLHVSVGKNADVCPDFVKGYCPRGEQCDKKHIIDCPEFSRSGSCPQGKKCPLRHRQRAKNRPMSPLETVAAVSPVKEPYAFKKIRQKLELRQAFRGSSKGGVVSSGAAVITPKELEFIPLDAPLGKEREQAPDFIAL